MRVTAEDLLMGGWWKGLGRKKRWSFRQDPYGEWVSFHEAVKLYKQGVRE